MPPPATGELAAIAGDEVVVAGLEGEAASLENATSGDGGGTSDGGSGEEQVKPPRPSGRFITIAVVSATLAAALVGFLFNHASQAGQHASDKAQELSLQASRLQTSAYQSAEDDYYNYLLQQSDAAKATQSYFETTLNDPDPQQWADLQNVTDHLATQEAKSLPKDMHPDDANGPNPNFPASYFAARTQTATQLSSQANAYNDISTQWGKLGGSFSAILTVLAIALLLLGSSLALYGSPRMMFVRLGVLLLAIAVVWAATATISEPGSQAATTAAQAYARGVTDAARVTTPTTARPALKEFTAAIQARPDYAQAYDLRAETEDSIGSLGPYSDYENVVATPWLKKAVQDERTAYGLGLRSENELTDFGMDSFDLWVSQGASSGFPSDALAADQDLTSVDSTDPVGWTEVGLADLLGRHYQQAQSAFTDSIENILYSNVSAKKLRPNHSFVDEQDWVGNAMTQLDQLINFDVGLAGCIPQSRGHSDRRTAYRLGGRRAHRSARSSASSAHGHLVDVQPRSQLSRHHHRPRVGLESPNGRTRPDPGERDDVVVFPAHRPWERQRLVECDHQHDRVGRQLEQLPVGQPEVLRRRRVLRGFFRSHEHESMPGQRTVPSRRVLRRRTRLHPSGQTHHVFRGPDRPARPANERRCVHSALVETLDITDGKLDLGGNLNASHQHTGGFSDVL